MEKKLIFAGNSATVSFTANDREIEILEHTLKVGYLEFKGCEERRMDSHKGVYEDEINSLIASDMIEVNCDAWHMQYDLTELGQGFIKNFINERTEKAEKYEKAVNEALQFQEEIKESNMLFDTLVERLKSEGYEITLETEENLFRAASLSGRGIVGSFCTKHDENDLNASRIYANGRISFDNSTAFSGLANCPYMGYFPKTEEEMIFLLERLAYWGSEEGFQKSNDFQYDPASISLDD